VLFPQLSPIALSALIILGHMSLKMFDIIMAISGEKNVYTSVPMVTMWTLTGQQDFARAAAVAIILLVFVGFLVVPYLVPHLTPGEEHVTTDVIPAAAPSELHRKVKKTPRSQVARTVKYLLLIFFLLVVLIPAYVLIVTSFKSFGEALGPNRWALPHGLSLEGWSAAWGELSPALGRTLLIAIPGAMISSMLGAMNGFVLSRWRFPGANLVFTLMLFGMFIPYQAVMVPLLEFLPMTGLGRGVPQLLAVHVVYGIPICTLIFRNYYQTIIPKELIESGKVDGAGLLRTFRSLILPLSVPGFVVTMIWQFTSIWNDYLFAVFLSSKDNGPVILGLANLAGSQIVPYPEVFAGALIVTAPTLLVYIVLGRWFVGGLMAGAVKS